MYLSQVKAENFRIFGSEADGKNLCLDFRKGLNVLVGENDAGKTAVLDAIRLCLGTTAHDYYRFTEDDFHKKQVPVGENGTEHQWDIANTLTITCKFEDLLPQEAAPVAEHLITENGQSVLYVTFKVTRNEQDGQPVRHRTYSTLHSGINGNGLSIDGASRDFIRCTYLKALRDADRELSAGKGSRLSQILLASRHMSGQDSDDSQAAINQVQNQTGIASSDIPQTLVGIMRLAEELIEQNQGIEGTNQDVNDNYLSNLLLAHKKLEGLISIGNRSGLRQVLEKLEALLLHQEDRTPRGLGLKNTLFMATEFLLLRNEGNLPLLLIEEPEAHLHPQMQSRMVDFLIKETQKVEKPVQVIVSTHSPHFAASVPLENMTILAEGKGYPLAQGQTELDVSDYAFLERFLDATKANLFFAKGVLIVEGDAENLLLPTLAKCLGRDLHEYGVSIVKVGHTGLFRYSRIFQRRSEEGQLPVAVACIGDRDERTDEQVSQFTEEHEGGQVRVFVSPQKTLEQDLCIVPDGKADTLARYVHASIYLSGRVPFDDAKRSLLLEEAQKAFDELTDDNRPAAIYATLTGNKSKAETAQHLARLLEEGWPDEDKLSPEQLRQLVPQYLLDAIAYVTKPFEDGDADT